VVASGRAITPRSETSAFRWFQRASLSRLPYPLLATAALGYSLVSFELSLAHALPMPEPYLRIADADYFFWGIFFYAPVIAAAWLLASSAIYLISRLAKLRPAFELMLKAVAFASAVGTLGTLLPDLITSPLRASGLIDEQAWELSISSNGGWFYFTWTTLIFYVILFVVGYTFAVKATTRATWWAAAAIGVSGFAIFQGFELIFIR
jgi:hypothetical protein